ncbi:MAG TPA: hypothetical protein VNZ52_15410 [Candidatus Thermoplasmatota archaeon]|nr:hypothetical protein [Candidatus Thermoplasmatota archaeon]
MKNLVSLVCARCGSRLVPAWSGLRCPRMTACGYGGTNEVQAPAPRFQGLATP